MQTVDYQIRVEIMQIVWVLTHHACGRHALTILNHIMMNIPEKNHTLEHIYLTSTILIYLILNFPDVDKIEMQNPSLNTSIKSISIDEGMINIEKGSYIEDVELFDILIAYFNVFGIMDASLVGSWYPLYWEVFLYRRCRVIRYHNSIFQCLWHHGCIFSKLLVPFILFPAELFVSNFSILKITHKWWYNCKIIYLYKKISIWLFWNMSHPGVLMKNKICVSFFERRCRTLINLCTWIILINDSAHFNQI